MITSKAEWSKTAHEIVTMDENFNLIYVRTRDVEIREISCRRVSILALKRLEVKAPIFPNDPFMGSQSSLGQRTALTFYSPNHFLSFSFQDEDWKYLMHRMNVLKEILLERSIFPERANNAFICLSTGNTSQCDRVKLFNKRDLKVSGTNVSEIWSNSDKKMTATSNFTYLTAKPRHSKRYVKSTLKEILQS